MLVGQRQWYESEGVETNAGRVALCTSHWRLEQAVKQINHDGFISKNVVLPRLKWYSLTHRVCVTIFRREVRSQLIFTHLSCYNLIVPAITVLQFHVRLELNSVEILVQTVQKKRQQFLTVVLFKVVELSCITANGVLKNNKTIMHSTKTNCRPNITQDLLYLPSVEQVR